MQLTIQEAVDSLKNAVYGKEVRDGLVYCVETLNDETTQAAANAKSVTNEIITMKTNGDFNGAKGEKGDSGTKGEKGDPVVSLKIGTVATGQPGTNAKATITGTLIDPILNFTIPRGNTGADGKTQGVYKYFEGSIDEFLLPSGLLYVCGRCVEYNGESVIGEEMMFTIYLDHTIQGTICSGAVLDRSNNMILWPRLEAEYSLADGGWLAKIIGVGLGTTTAVYNITRVFWEVAQ